MVPVRFNRSMAPYNAGETAGFDAARADRLVAQGYVTKIAPHGAVQGDAVLVQSQVTPAVAPPSEAPAPATAPVLPPAGPPAPPKPRT